MGVDIETAAETLVNQARRLAPFAGISKPHSSDRIFLVMGMTGSGKSTFISRCTGKPVVVGHQLYSCKDHLIMFILDESSSLASLSDSVSRANDINIFSGTDSIDIFDFDMNGRKVHLVDTPGFNDTTRSDIDTLGILATWLGASYANGARIHGIVVLHPISDNRMSGSSIRNLEMIKAICGSETYKNVAVATTMWPEAPSYAETRALNARQAELVDDDRFFGSLVNGGASIFQHNQNGRRYPSTEASSAKCIVEHLLQQSDLFHPNALQLQYEIVDQGKTIGETTAGIAAAGELYKARKAYEEQLRKLKSEMESRLEESDTVYAAQLREVKAEAEMKLQIVEMDALALNNRMKDLHEKEEKELRRKLVEMDRLFRKEIEAKEQDLLDMEVSLKETRKDLARKSRNPRIEHEEIVSSARAQVEKARKEHQNFKEKVGNIVKGDVQGGSENQKRPGHLGNIISGGASGIASGTMAGLIGVGKLLRYSHETSIY
jgi:hypothetical protein